MGSVALSHFNMNRNNPKDVDVWMNDKSHHLLSDVLSCCDVLVMPQHILDLVEYVEINGVKYATPNSIYTIKCSHLGWSNPAWQKHKLDILWLKHHGCEIIEELYQALLVHWKGTLGDKSFLNLDKSKEQFFTDKVVYVHDHDYLHELVAHPNRPMYEKCLRQDKEVLIDKDKFDTLSIDDQVRIFREEMSVIALERWVLNPYWNNYKRKQINWYRAYLLALQKTITNLTKNWATDFIVQHLEKFATPDFSYFKHAIQTLTDEGNTNMNEQLNKFKEALGVCCNDDTFIRALADGELLDLDIEYPEHLKVPDGVRWPDTRSYWKAQEDWLESVTQEHRYEHIMQEGGGEYCEGVFKLGGQHYKASWSYYSHHGYEDYGCANTLQEVTPTEKTITVWN